MDITVLTDEFIRHKKQQGFGERYISRLKYTLANLRRYMGNTTDYTPQIGMDYLSERTQPLSTYRYIRTLVSQLNDYNREKTVKLLHSCHGKVEPPKVFSDCLDFYEKHCKNQGNRDKTIEIKVSSGARLLYYIEAAGCQSLKHITPEIVMKASLMEPCRRRWQYYRQILRFFFEEDMVTADYSLFVPKFLAPIPLPNVYTKSEIEKLENAFNRDNPLDKRDYAMVLLADRLGIRRGDISAMRFSNLDFDKSLIVFTQSKTGKEHQLKMLPIIKNALMDYISNGRPNVDSDYVFIRHKLPFHKMSGIGIHSVFKRRMKKAGIQQKGRKLGPHSLRASLATAMINDGVSYELTRKVLGHDDPNAIRRYVRLDIEKLRVCAGNPFPLHGFFAKYIEGGIDK